MAQPTRGLDVGSIEFVHRRIVAERDGGAGVVLVSAELDEVLGLADRIGVMYRGRIIGEVAGRHARADEIGLLMAGSTTEHAATARRADDRAPNRGPTPNRGPDGSTDDRRDAGRRVIRPRSRRRARRRGGARRRPY